MIEHPIYDVQLFSRKDPIKIRPFLVKEQKLLMMAAESKEIPTTVATIKQIINNCSLTELDIDSLPLIDLEILFLNLRARSMGEIASVYFQCKNQIEEKECGMVLDVPVNLLEVPIINKNREKKIMFSENVGVIMKYPAFNLIENLNKNTVDSESEFIIVAGSIDKIFNVDDVYNAADATQDELLEFLMNLPQDKYDLMREFIENSPRSKLDIKQKCGKCSYEHSLTLEGLTDFFI